LKTAWIFAGGAARSVYTAGVLYALCEMDIPRPDIIIGCSGMAPTSICYVTGQKEIIKNVWCRSLSTTKFVSFWRLWKIVDINYLIDTVLKENNPLDMKKLKESPITVYWPVTNSETGEINYISNETGLDIWEVLRAAVSVPICTNLFSVMGNPVNGQYYSDSPPASRFQLHIKKAAEEGAERIIVFDSWHTDENPTGYFISKVYACLRNGEFRRNQLSYFREMENFSPPSGIHFLYLSPASKLAMSRYKIDNKNARKIFEQGYRETLSRKELRDLTP